MMIKGATGVAAVAAIGNFLQGWDGGAIAGALLYLKPEFHLEATPALEGLVVASTLIGAVASVAVAGPAADWVGRKCMLCISGVLYSLAALVMLWAPTVYILILSRIVVGGAIGLASTIAPILISESAPAESRGQLATFPQLLGSSGLLFAYIMDFVLSLQPDPNWRFMLGVLSVPSVIYVFLCFFLLPESSRWLVSKGRMHDAKVVLQNLRGQEDVSGKCRRKSECSKALVAVHFLTAKRHACAAEMALLVEGLGVVAEAHLEEWLVKPAEKMAEDDEPFVEEGQIKIYGPDESVTWVATPIVDDFGVHQHSGILQTDSHDLHSVLPLIDPMVTLLGNFQHHADQLLVSREVYDDDHKVEQWDEEAPGTPRFRASGYHSETDMGEVEENLQTPLLGGSTGSGRYNSITPRSPSNSQDRYSHFFTPRMSRQSSWRSNYDGGVAESLGNVGIGGGWQLAWQKDGEEGALKRVFLKSEGGDMSHFNSTLSLPGVGNFLTDADAFQAAVLVTQPAPDNELLNEHPVGPAMIHPAEHAKQGPAWSNLIEGGVRRALIVGVGLQILQQFSGINAVLYFTPQILMQSGAEDLLASIGIDGESASILASAITSLLMLPCILMAMRLMDKSGRRHLLLATLPILVISLVALVLANMFLTTGLMAAAISFTFVTIFTCSFVTGFGPIPNILCSEIFPTSVRGLCIGICAAAMWSSNVIVTYSFPLVNQQLGLQGVFGLFAIVSVVAWIFVFLKVPETKGLPLEIISEFFAVAPPKKESDRKTVD